MSCPTRAAAAFLSVYFPRRIEFEPRYTDGAAEKVMPLSALARLPKILAVCPDLECLGDA